MIKTDNRREHLLSRLKAKIERLLARRRREEPVPQDRSLPSSDRVFEILGDVNQRSGGPAKDA